ncbi:hypothetical protein AV530_003195 [Patagioenas fasciata monilis]|uniref:Uncharacterized protein n=1 Tax=Patagioenas fasciata monilis TaxID=372326 RepID=A0A1V4KWI1_PATFA|nr:hypothetical protein AV530_003195 [Patagioenas fasciata monilis]
MPDLLPSDVLNAPTLGCYRGGFQEHRTHISTLPALLYTLTQLSVMVTESFLRVVYGEGDSGIRRWRRGATGASSAPSSSF